MSNYFLSNKWGIVCQYRNKLGPSGCSAWGYLAGVTLLTSMSNLAIIAFNRYYLIGHSQSYPQVFTKRNSLVMCGVIWLLAFMVMLPTLTGWTRNKYNPKTNACSFSRDESKAFTYLLLVFAYGIPLTTVVASYSKLYFIVRKSTKRVTQIAVIPKADKKSEEGHSQKQKSDVVPAQTTNVVTSQKAAPVIKQRDMKLTKMLVIIFLVFLVLITPYALINVLDTDNKMSRTFYTLVSWVMLLNCAVNPLLYALMNPNFRAAYVVLLTARCKGSDKVPGIDLDHTANATN